MTKQIEGCVGLQILELFHETRYIIITHSFVGLLVVYQHHELYWQ